MKKIGLLSFVIALMLLAHINVWACGCQGRDEDITKAVILDFNKASIIFSGKIAAAEWIPIVEKNASGKEIKAEALLLKFAVDSWWKGKTKDEVIWHTTDIRYPDSGELKLGSNCEYGFELGKKYLVYAVDLKGKLIAGACSGTTRIENAEKDIKELQKLKVKERNSQESPKLTDEDKSFIIKSILEQIPEIKKQISQEPTEEKLVIKLSGENINAKLLPTFPNVEFVLLNASDIKNYKGKSLDYREFGKFEVNAFGRVTVVFSETNLYKGYLPSGNGTTFEYQKVNGKWVGKAVSYYINN
ncbi:MAG: hypothetical protein LC768_03235 [Acidobacteria bacterium]|nr:hypothetical protein [Acidobacteriota bacterium]MCA1637342.1 hypothetical protein [Acidobacteriota bacterium]